MSAIGLFKCGDLSVFFLSSFSGCYFHCSVPQVSKGRRNSLGLQSYVKECTGYGEQVAQTAITSTTITESVSTSGKPISCATMVAGRCSDQVE